MAIVDKRIHDVIKMIVESRWTEQDLPGFSLMMEAVVLADYANQGPGKPSGPYRAELKMTRPSQKQYGSKVRYALSECKAGMANNIAYLLEMRQSFQEQNASQEWERFVRTYFALYCTDVKIVESLT